MIDYHSHCLPEIDDGADNVKTSIEILKLLKNQGVDIVVATPHYYAHCESVSDFLNRREKSFNLLKENIENAKDVPKIILGAEVFLERFLSDTSELFKLCIGETNYILLELPLKPYKNWFAEEIHNIACSNSVKPVFAHINRYFDIYDKAGFTDVFLSDPDYVLQINNEFIGSRKAKTIVDRLIKSNYKIIFGSDAHDTASRPPNFDIFKKHGASKYLQNEYNILENELAWRNT